MKAILNIYADCTSEQPTKTYTCHRLLLGVSVKIEELQKKINETNDAKEQEKYTIQIIKTIFPTFDEKEFYYIDPKEWVGFCNEITNESAQVQQAAIKN